MSWAGFAMRDMGTSTRDGAGSGDAVNVGYLTEVSVRNVSMSRGEDLILSVAAIRRVLMGRG